MNISVQSRCDRQHLLALSAPVTILRQAGSRWPATGSPPSRFGSYEPIPRALRQAIVTGPRMSAVGMSPQCQHRPRSVRSRWCKGPRQGLALVLDAAIADALSEYISPTNAGDLPMELKVGSGRAARLIAEAGALERPFVLVDIGVRDGIHDRWAAFEPALQVYGFDAIAEVDPPNERHRYFRLAIGDFDGECLFDVPENRYEARISSAGSVRVPMAKLDTLWSKGSLPTADFIKIDCEGYEPEILRGAARYLAASNVLGADVETNFNISPTLPRSHFVGIAEPLVAERLLLADLAFGTAAFPSGLPWPGTCNVLFTRHFINERDHQENYVMRNAEGSPTADEILKMIAIFDLYSLSSPARALLTRFRDIIEHRVDTAALLNCLPDRPPRVYAFERLIPHLGLGLWSGAKRVLGLS